MGERERLPRVNVSCHAIAEMGGGESLLEAIVRHQEMEVVWRREGL